MFERGVLEKLDVIKLNIYEFKCFFDVDENDLNFIVSLVRKFIESGIKKVLILMGVKGVVFVIENMWLFVKAVEVEVKSIIGVGDLMVAVIFYGFL